MLCDPTAELNTALGLDLDLSGFGLGTRSQRYSMVVENGVAKSIKGVRRVRSNHAGCFNVCEHGPLIVIYPDAVWCRYHTDHDIEVIFRSHVLTGRPVERL